MVNHASLTMDVASKIASRCHTLFTDGFIERQAKRASVSLTTDVLIRQNLIFRQLNLVTWQLAKQLNLATWQLAVNVVIF